MLKTKSVSEPMKMEDGLRILVTRFLGRYMKTNRYDVWMPNLGPSEKLLRNGGKDWKDFQKLYTEEIFGDAKVDKDNQTIKNHGQKFTLRLIKELARKGNVTLMCHCENEEQCHRNILKKIIKSSRI
jgi:uncharacterized protein YeaO (DUF488 family)